MHIVSFDFLTYATSVCQQITHRCRSCVRAGLLPPPRAPVVVAGLVVLVPSGLSMLVPFLFSGVCCAVSLSIPVGSCPLEDTACACGSGLQGLVSVSVMLFVSLFPLSPPREACNPDIASPTHCQLLLTVADSPFPPAYCLT